MRLERLTAVVFIEVAVLAAMGLIWVAGDWSERLARASVLQPWVPYAAVAWGLLTVLALAGWMATPRDTHGRARLLLGFVLIVMLAFGAYAFAESYLGSAPFTTRTPGLP